MKHVVPGTFFMLALACAGCVKEAPSVPAPTATATSPTATATTGPESCLPCHADEVARWKTSSHRLAARPFSDTLQPSVARLSPDALILPAGRDAAALSDGAMLAPDASGATEARAITHVLGGRRREDFLSPRPDGAHVLPLSWSLTRAAWTDPSAEDQGAPINPKGALGWTKPLRSHESACSRCHPVAETPDAPGITCATCHAETADHSRASAADHSRASAAKAAPSTAATDPWNGCGACHAVGFDIPRVAGARVSDPLLDSILPDTLVLTEGFNPAFALDGRPIVPHGREVQSLAQSACFRKGGANCVTCHDPHGGERTSLKQADPDASCRGCHAEIAASPATHARHPVATTSVPLSRDEPGGPWQRGCDGSVAAKTPRLPGCVDCHLPAILGFSPDDAIRDHAIGIPDLGTARSLGVADACTACHPGWTPKRLAPSLPAASAPNARRDRAKVFAAAARAMLGRVGSVTQQRETLSGSLTMLSDENVDPWTRASAASLVGTLGRVGGTTPTNASGVDALASAWRSGPDPVLRRAIAGAFPATGGTADALVALAADETDWRVRIAVAAALGSAQDPRAAEQLDTLRRDAALPAQAHAAAAFELATLLLASGSATRSEALLLESLDGWPSNAAAWVNLGTIRANAGNATGAREAWERALELSPGNAIARANLASLNGAQGEAATP